MKEAILYITLITALSTSVFTLEMPSETVVQSPNGSQQVIETCTPPPEGSPQELIEELFVLEGYLYAFVDIMKTENRTNDIRAEAETVTIEIIKDNLSLILEQLTPIIDYDDGQYQGTLALDRITVRTEVIGYTTKSHTAIAAKMIEPVDRNDMSYVPATTVKNGRTLNLSNAEWQVTGTELMSGVLISSFYQAVVTYSGATSYSATAGCVITVDYVGEVSRDEVESVTYQLTYSGKADASAGSEDGSWFLSVLSTRWLYTLGGVGGAVFLILVTLLSRSRQRIKCLRSEQESVLPEDDGEEKESERKTDLTIS